MSCPFLKTWKNVDFFFHIIHLFGAKNRVQKFTKLSILQSLFFLVRNLQILFIRKKSYFSKSEYFSGDVFTTLKRGPKILRKTVEQFSGCFGQVCCFGHSKDRIVTHPLPHCHHHHPVPTTTTTITNITIYHPNQHHRLS